MLTGFIVGVRGDHAVPRHGCSWRTRDACAFDVLAIDGDDLRRLPLSMRKANLQRLLARRPDGIFISEFEQGEIGPDLFREACEFGLEDLVSKHRDRPCQGGRSKHWLKVKNRKHRPYQGGRFKHWLKVKNRSHPAFDRVQEAAGRGPSR